MNKKIRRILTITLLPIVILGMYLVYQKTKKNEIYAVDPMVVTYNGSIPPSPLFTLDDMKPGDEYKRCFNVKNAYTEEFAVEMSTFMSLEEKKFTDILEIIVYDPDTNGILFSSLLHDFFADSPFALGNFSAGADRDFCIKVYFPHDAGNEYQEAKVIFDIIWRTEIPENDIPPECWKLADQFDSVIYGTEGNDDIHGNVGSNLIFALGGNDVVDSSSGNDCVVLGDGDDYVESESGDDVILGGNGNDEIKSGSDNDKVYGGPGNDDIEAGSGNDTVWGGSGNDDIEAGSGNDTVWGGSGNDDIDTESGDDTAYGEGGNDIILGSSNDDYLDGGEDNDDLDGESGTDICVNGEILDSCEL